MKLAATLTTLSALVGGFAIYSYATENESAEASGPSEQKSARKAVPATGRTALPSNLAVPATSAPVIELRRVSRIERTRRFALHKKSSTGQSKPQTGAVQTSLPAPVSPKGDREIIKAAIAEVRPLIEECFALAQLRDPALAGMIAVRFTISDEPDIAGLVTEAEVSRRRGGFNPPNLDFEECLEETMMSLEFIGMSRGIAITYPFVFRLPPGVAPPKRISGSEIAALIDQTSEAQQLVVLADEYRKSEPNLAMKACDKAVSIDSSVSPAYICTLLACELGRKEQALGFWSAINDFDFGRSLVDRAVNRCATSRIRLPH